MIERLLTAARRRTEAADVRWHRVERTTVSFESGRLKACGLTEETGVNLRVVVEGRVGIAGSTAQDHEELLARALASAELGEALALELPTSAPLAPLSTHAPRAAAASLDQLAGLGRELVGRLDREGCQVNVSIEREIAETRVANSAGVDTQYAVTGVALGVDRTRFAGDDVLLMSDYYSGVDLPSEADLAALVRSIEQRFAPALRVVEPPEGVLPVVFTPAGLSAILLPLEQALSGKAVLQGISPLAGKLGEQVVDPRLSLTDDALVPGRPSSRPVDDEGVPSRVVALVERGVVKQFVYDLETAARARTASTGHGSRGTFGKPHIGYSNLLVGNGKPGRTTGEGHFAGGLSESVADGLVIDDLIGVGQGNVIGGAFSHPVALAYRVQRGEITGRVKDAAVAGNVYELLKRIGGFGDDARWLGSRWAPSLLLEGVAVARR
ncbi:MAG: TldD/PmbA family protein [Gemmatimonadales bacterium]